MILGMLGALLTVAQVALAVLPNIELISVLITVYALVLGKHCFAPIYVFVLLEGLLYGFGMWWAHYLYVWPLLAAVVLLLHKRFSMPLAVLINGAFGLFFGALCALTYLFIGGYNAALAYWISGLPFDFLHCAGNVAAALVLFRPLLRIFQKMLGGVFVPTVQDTPSL
ncbi:hypothetical protein LJC07_03450 [Christensenellaceae bacterium OttesenSCG-928-L17]|nr:hypothetical protein [Christensenellaceae bacterium OttesenSCG-928-L17]